MGHACGDSAAGADAVSSWIVTMKPHGWGKVPAQSRLAAKVGDSESLLPHQTHAQLLHFSSHPAGKDSLAVLWVSHTKLFPL